jgi:hypothetical protein
MYALNSCVGRDFLIIEEGCCLKLSTVIIVCGSGPGPDLAFLGSGDPVREAEFIFKTK